MTDEEIVERILAGDQGLFAILMTRHHRRILRAVRGIVRDVQEVDDMIQQTYLNAYAHLDQFAGKSKFSTWLLRIAIHEALARVREEELAGTAGSVEFAAEILHQPENPGPNPEQQAFTRELQRVIEQEILALPTRYRVVLLLRDVEDLNTKETADCLNVGGAVVRTRLRRARAMLRERLLKRAGISPNSLFSFLDDRCDRPVAVVRPRIAPIVPA